MLLVVNLLLLSNMLLGSRVKALYSLTPRELLNIAGIVSTKCLKNCQTDGILVRVANLWIETKI